MENVKDFKKFVENVLMVNKDVVDAITDMPCFEDSLRYYQSVVKVCQKTLRMLEQGQPLDEARKFWVKSMDAIPTVRR